MYELYQRFCLARQATGKFRILPAPLNGDAADYIDFSTNDYLGLSNSPELIKAAVEVARQLGTGATGSRLLSGNSALITQLESQIARDKKTEGALIFNSGFQANSAVLSSLLDAKVMGQKPLVFFDRLNHASLYQGVFASDAKLFRYAHCDVTHLGELLHKYRHISGPRFIVTETIFGMDGDIAPLKAIIELCEQYNAFLYLDEAHATGMIGERGYGLSTQFDLSKIPHVIMGTFSKALGCSGAYIATAHTLKTYLINHCAGFIYSTAPSPMLIGAMQKAWSLVATKDETRQKIFLLSADLRNQLKACGWETGQSVTNIVPIILKNENTVMQMQKKLFQQNIKVSAVRPPTVPPKGSRLRIAVTVHHQNEQIDKLLDILGRVN